VPRESISELGPYLVKAPEGARTSS
jgi:hypothetical protein